MGDIVTMTVDLPGPEGDPLRLILKGREAWALDQLLAAGARGCTSIDRPAPRWSHYVWLLRRDGLAVETIHEAHAGSYSGHHARYVLRSPVNVVREVRS
jgi:hypothetical protein